MTFPLELGPLLVATLTFLLVGFVKGVVGMILGGWVRGQVSEPVFRRCFFLGLIALGLHLASRAML